MGLTENYNNFNGLGDKILTCDSYVPKVVVLRGPAQAM
jgi:hypothetical protein